MSFADHLPEYEPERIAIGETAEWRKVVPDFPPGEGWTLTYYVRGAGRGFDQAGVTDGDGYKIVVANTVTALMSAGKYYFEARVSNGSEEHEVARGEMLAVLSIKGMATTATLDDRSPAQQILDAIDAMAVGKATLDQQSYQIGTRQLARIPISELLKLRSTYAQLVARERRAARLKEGAPFLKNVLVRFDRPQ
ncbi:MAG TPA: hypothetical protein VHU19_14275 [Pyrinomonadaceae bacterium]|jgi:hypothetical protein|nr:hypothetical protein [Pyrinomonadaceae bacterium]